MREVLNAKDLKLLDEWIDYYSNSKIKEIKSFVNGVLKDYTSVANAIIYHIKDVLYEIESYRSLIDRIIIDPSAGNLFSMDDTATSNKNGYSSQKIESMISEFKNTYMR